jgi:Fe-S-cluster containining protein
MARHAESIACGKGCSECCHGLFDITLLDAALLLQGFERLPEATRKEVVGRCEAILKGLRRFWPDLSHPFILNVREEEAWEELMPEDDDTPCPLLALDGSCLLYDYRPMTCRLNGLPLFNLDGEAFHDEWCTNNFIDTDVTLLTDLRFGFHQLFSDELALFHRFTQRLIGETHSELDTLIPLALLVDFHHFDWPSWWHEARPLIHALRPTS